ncbi:phage tail sheath family protein [Algoriphagus chordae]|uniref:Tail sheath protein C-terminal domain-containing protein n=1 Tax=Algoriphagus chordae TaxID=237019 RepID=A0A2W7QY88_9BACT|nr:phage tail sheath C-terminal domain-containing protein [Algoriphagus chordae]PZX53244.1 hypothetical protein LV85_01662 [Algoriphagus chordae]
MAAKYKTPGVYLTEVNAFPNSVAPVATAIPAFVGYTPQAEYQGESYLNKPIKIRSWIEFLAFFCYPQKGKSQPQQYSPNYFVNSTKGDIAAKNQLSFAQRDYVISPDPSTIYYLYLSVMLFYQNGGGDAYIVSVGNYGEPSGKALKHTDPLVNSNVSLNDLLQGLYLLKKETEPTMYIFPEATLLSASEYAKLTQAMLRQCEELGTAISILDVPCGGSPDQLDYARAIEDFRSRTGNNGLSYGAAYFPFLYTNLLQIGDLDYTNLFAGDIEQLEALLNPKDSDPALKNVFDMIKGNKDQSMAVDQLNHGLLRSSEFYTIIYSKLLDLANLLPPSGGMAGVISTNDMMKGVWYSPANVSIASVRGVPVSLNDAQQSTLNVDAFSGKSINAIRTFPGVGVLVWGARTLDGNSLDLKYINVRRMLIYLEQSCKIAVKTYAFEPNNQRTWTALNSIISSFLIDLWKQGGLAGASAQDAFQVECGLGITMSAVDILEGRIVLSIKVALTRPAEFVVITIQQQMTKSA